MNEPTQPTTSPVDRHCIEVEVRPDDTRTFTVAEYDAVQRERYNQPLWAYRVDPVEQLTAEGHWPYPTRITDTEAYNAQMRRLLGLD
jgi:hypothetical protein